MRTRVTFGLTLAGIAALAAAGAWLTDDPGGALDDPRTSTLVPGPEGSQALHETLAELGIPVQRRRSAFFDLGEDEGRIGALAVLAPPIDLLSDELAEVVGYLRSGGALIVAGDGGGITACLGFESPRADGGIIWDGAPAGIGRQYRVRAAASGGRLPLTRRVVRPIEHDDDVERAREAARERAGCDLLVPWAADTLLRTLDGRVVALSLAYRGDGRVLLVADPVFFRNRAWRETDVAHFMIPLLVPARRGALVWDEFHQGFGSAESGATQALREWLRSSPAGWALLQLAAVALVWILVSAVRFGPALSVIERRRRSPLEHVDALAAGLEGAAGTDTAVALIVSGLRRRLSRAGHAGPADLAGWLASLQLVLPTARGRAAARRLEHLLNERGGDERVLATAQAVEDVWQDLRPARHPARF